MKRMLAAVTATTLLLIGAPADAETALDRAAANWIALQNGSKRLADLSGQEIDEVRELDRQIAKKAITSRDCERQRDAAKTDLDRAVLSLKCPPAMAGE